MEYDNYYNANTGELTRVPRKAQGPPPTADSGTSYEPPIASPPNQQRQTAARNPARGGAPSKYGDLLLFATLLMLWLERQEEDALFTLLALLLL